MGMTRVPDDAWAQLEPSAVRLSKLSRWGLAVAMTSAATATILIALGVASGQLGGSLYTPTWDFSIDTSAHTFAESISIRNEAWFDETITDVGFSSRDLRVTEVDPTPLTIPHGQTRTLRVVVQVSDCVTAPRGDAYPVVHLDRFWGTQSVTIQVLSWTHGLQEGSYPLWNGPAWAACGKGD
jgi:hypothetical protein